MSTLDDQIHMKDVLVRLHRQNLEDESVSIDGEDTFLGGIPYSRAFAFAEGDLTLEDLTQVEREFLHSAVDSSLKGNDCIIQAWSPWWESEEAKDMTLSDQGMPVVQELESTGTPSEAMSSLPKAPESPLPALSSLTSKQPSPLLMYHLVDLLFWYALILRALNGDCESAEADVVCLLSSCSRALSPEKQVTEDIGLENVVNEILETACTGVKPYFGSIPRGMAIGTAKDVAGIISLGRTGVILALSDLLRTILRSEVDLINNNVDGKRSSGKQTLAKFERKLVFMLAWANESIDEDSKHVMSNRLETIYRQHMSSLDNENKSDDIFFTSK